MEYLILTRPLSLGDLKVMPYMPKGFELSDYAIKLYEDPALLLEFVTDMLLESGAEDKDFSRLLNHTYSDIKPSDIYIHLLDKDKRIPTFYVGKYDAQKRKFSNVRRAFADDIRLFIKRLNGEEDDDETCSD